jgi:hypothetical protein
MLRTRRNNEGRPRFRERDAGNQMDRTRKRLIGLDWEKGQRARDKGLEIIAEQLETLSKIDWSQFRGS